MKRTTKNYRLKQLGIGLATGALIALPLIAVTAQPAGAQSGRYRYQQNRNNNRVRGTMYATVTRDLGGNRFEVRADDNRLFNVRSRSGEPRRLRVGDRVLLEGYINNRNVFVAESVRRVTGGTNTGGVVGNIDFYGTVVNVASSRRVIVRADDGRNFTVSTRNALARAITRGDRVRVTGSATNGNDVRSANVALVTNSNGATPATQAFRMDGTVLADSMRGRTFQLRGANGRNYNVRPNNNSAFNRGDRLRIVGRLSNGILYATSITRL